MNTQTIMGMFSEKIRPLAWHFYQKGANDQRAGGLQSKEQFDAEWRQQTKILKV